MIRKTLISMGFLVSACSPAIAQDVNILDHYKQIIDQKPYHVEVCKNVTTSGDKSGDALMGAIIGGIIGNNITKDLPDGGTAGAIIGGLLGHQNSDAKGGTQRRCNTEIRYNEEVRTIYSHSTVTFWYNGKKHSLKFRK